MVLARAVRRVRTSRFRRLRSSVAAATILGICLALLAVGPVLGHEERDVAGFTFTVGFIDEPVYVGQKSGLEFDVTKAGQPVEGLEKTLQAEVIRGQSKLALSLSPRFGQAGWYQSYFFPTEAGTYTFHIFGTVQGQQVDETFVSGKTTFDDVQDVATGQFPVQFPAQADLIAQAEKGSDAAGQMPLAIGLGAAGAVLGLIALGVALAGLRRRPG